MRQVQKDGKAGIQDRRCREPGKAFFGFVPFAIQAIFDNSYSACCFTAVFYFWKIDGLQPALQFIIVIPCNMRFANYDLPIAICRADKRFLPWL
jgi:hypothetical protein